jgi:hypothetical protein
MQIIVVEKGVAKTLRSVRIQAPPVILQSLDRVEIFAVGTTAVVACLTRYMTVDGKYAEPNDVVVDRMGWLCSRGLPAPLINKIV